MPFSPEVKEEWKQIKESMRCREVSGQPEYYLSRQEESTNAAIIVGICLVLSAIIYFVCLFRG